MKIFKLLSIILCAYLLSMAIESPLTGLMSIGFLLLGILFVRVLFTEPLEAQSVPERNQFVWISATLVLTLSLVQNLVTYQQEINQSLAATNSSLTQELNQSKAEQASLLVEITSLQNQITTLKEDARSPIVNFPSYEPSAICNDGTFSYSTSRSGTCSYHGGVRSWL